MFRPLTDGLRGFDPYMVLADFRSYADCQRRVAAAYTDAADWTRRAILNCARSGYFSSDRTIDEYCRDIWRVTPLPIRPLTPGQVQAGLM